MSTWAELSQEDKQQILDKIANVYEMFDYPEWLKNPTISSTIVNVLNQNMQQKEGGIVIEGKADSDMKDTVAAIKDALQQALGSVTDAEIKLSTGKRVGSKVEPMTGVNKVYIDGQAAEGSCTVEHKQGQVMLLDLWATWCPPCQAPMAHNQHMLETRKDWGDKVRIIGLSIDQDVATVKNHIENKKWTTVEHYHVKTAGCTVSQEYGSSGVPHVCLIDTTGKIVFKGHPASRKLEEDIDNLLKGEKLTGVEEPEAAESDEQAAASEFKDEEVDKAAAKFLTESKEFMTANLESSKKLARAFLVLEDESKFNCKTKKLQRNITCITQLMGPKDAIDAVKVEAAKVNKGPWKNVDQERVM